MKVAQMHSLNHIIYSRSSPTEIVVEDNHAPYSRVVKHASKTASAPSSDASPPATLPGDLSTLISVTPLAQGMLLHCMHVCLWDCLRGFV